jgi:hypothetical protein
MYDFLIISSLTLIKPSIGIVTSGSLKWGQESTKGTN